MMSLTFGLFTQVSDSGPQGPLVSLCYGQGTVRRAILYEDRSCFTSDGELLPLANVCCPLCVVRLQQFALNISSETSRPRAMIFGM